MKAMLLLAEEEISISKFKEKTLSAMEKTRSNLSKKEEVVSCKKKESDD